MGSTLHADKLRLCLREQDAILEFKFHLINAVKILKNKNNPTVARIFNIFDTLPSLELNNVLTGGCHKCRYPCCKRMLKYSEVSNSLSSHSALTDELLLNIMDFVKERFIGYSCDLPYTQEGENSNEDGAYNR